MSEHTDPEDPRAPDGAPDEEESPLGGMLALLLDVGVPVASYYVLSKALGLSTVAALAWSGAVPAARTSWSVLVRRRTNRFALTVLVVTLVGIAVSLWTGDARLMLAKDAAATGVFGLAVLISCLRGTPVMSAALEPWLVRGDPRRGAAWRRLSASCGAFRAAERRYSLVWGFALLADCLLRVIGAYTLPVDVMVWFGTVILGVCVVTAVFVSRGAATKPMERMVGQASAPRAHPSPRRG